jgi:hypothetical protein
LLGHESSKTRAGQTVMLDDAPTAIGDGDLENIFCQIDGERSTIHGMGSSCARSLFRWHYDAEKSAGGSPSHQSSGRAKGARR